MPIIQILVVLIVIGVLMWLVNSVIPMADPWRKIVNVVAIIFTVLWLLQVFGLLGGFSVWRAPAPLR